MKEQVEAVRAWAVGYDVDRHSHESAVFRKFVKSCDALLAALEQTEARKRKKEKKDKPKTK